jgi:hypothetical protein
MASPRFPRAMNNVMATVQFDDDTCTVRSEVRARDSQSMSLVCRLRPFIPRRKPVILTFIIFSFLVSIATIFVSSLLFVAHWTFSSPFLPLSSGRTATLTAPRWASQRRRHLLRLGRALSALTRRPPLRPASLTAGGRHGDAQRGFAQTARRWANLQGEGRRHPSRSGGNYSLTRRVLGDVLCLSD